MSLQDKVKFFEWPDPRAIRGGAGALKRFNKSLTERREKYPHSENKYGQEIEELNTRGYCVVKNAVPRSFLESVQTDLDRYLEGKDRDASFTKFGQCMMYCPSILPLCFHEIPIAIASEYYGCTPAIDTVNLRKSFADGLPPHKTELYHSDPNSVRFLKAFFYLHDVDKATGPFTYVTGSVNKKFAGWDKKYRWSDQEVEKVYGKQRVKHLVANAGDLIMASPTGFHKGLKPKKNDRSMLATTYVMHIAKWGVPKMRISQIEYDKLSAEQKKVAEFLIVEST